MDEADTVLLAPCGDHDNRAPSTTTCLSVFPEKKEVLCG